MRSGWAELGVRVREAEEEEQEEESAVPPLAHCYFMTSAGLAGPGAGAGLARGGAGGAGGDGVREAVALAPGGSSWPAGRLVNSQAAAAVVDSGWHK